MVKKYHILENLLPRVFLACEQSFHSCSTQKDSGTLCQICCAAFLTQEPVRGLGLSSSLSHDGKKKRKDPGKEVVQMNIVKEKNKELKIQKCRGHKEWVHNKNYQTNKLSVSDIMVKKSIY